MRKFIPLFALLALASSSQGAILTLTANLTGSQEVPGVGTNGFGDGMVQIDTVALTYTGYVRWQGLTGTPTDSHIHVGVPGTAGSVIYGYGVAGTVADGAYTKKTFSGSLVDKTPANHGGAGTSGTLTPTQQIASWFSAGKTYLNVHSTFVGSGEIRGQLTPVPEPASMAALGLGTAALLRRRAKK